MDCEEKEHGSINAQIEKYMTVVTFFKCELCNFQNQIKEKTRSHMKLHIMHKCTSCSMSYFLQSDLSNHVTQCHSSETIDVSHSDEDNINFSSDNEQSIENVIDQVNNKEDPETDIPLQDIDREILTSVSETSGDDFNRIRKQPSCMWKKKPKHNKFSRQRIEKIVTGTHCPRASQEEKSEVGETVNSGLGSQTEDIRCNETYQPQTVVTVSSGQPVDQPGTMTVSASNQKQQTSSSALGENNVTLLMPLPTLQSPVASQTPSASTKTIAMTFPAGSVIIQPPNVSYATVVTGCSPITSPHTVKQQLAKNRTKDISCNANRNEDVAASKMQGKVAIQRQSVNQPIHQTSRDIVDLMSLHNTSQPADTTHMTPEEAINYNIIKEAKARAVKMTQELRMLTAVQCHFCDRKFLNGRAKARHVSKFHCDMISKEKSTGGPYYCSVSSCKYKTVYKHNLETHTKRHASPHMCNQCNKKFITKRQLETHQKSDIHLLKKDYLLCHTCGYSTSRKDTFKEHLSSHMEEKPLKCDQCAYRTSSKKLLTRHAVRVHKLSDQLQKCTSCNYSCHTEQELKIHFAKHTGETMFNCPQCKFGSNYKHNFIKHLKRHSLEMVSMEDGYVVIPKHKNSSDSKISTDTVDKLLIPHSEEECSVLS